MAWRETRPKVHRVRHLHTELTSGADAIRCAQVSELRLWFAVDATLLSVSVERWFNRTGVVQRQPGDPVGGDRCRPGGVRR